MIDKSIEIAILMPLRNDWESFSILYKKLDQEIAKLNIVVDIHVIDDYSDIASLSELNTQHIRNIYTSRLVRNLGHQRAIAIGLFNLSKNYQYDYVIVMDSDGEDCPQHVIKLFNAAIENPDTVIVAARNRRSESLQFRIFYSIYKLVFATLTGRLINFGNFCIIPASRFEALISNNGLWNHLASTLLASRIPLIKLPTERCNRYRGHSSMNFTALIIHGLSAVSTFLEEITVRMLILSLLIGMIAISGIIIVVVMRFFTELAIPGWATSAVGLLTVVLGQAIFFIFFLVLTTLQTRSNYQVLDYQEILDLIASHDIIST